MAGVMEAKQKIIVAVAPVSHVGKELPVETRNPLTPEEVANEAIRCAEEGASIVHLHVRDDRGVQVSDLSWFRSTLDLIDARADVIINGSTGGVSDLSLEDRCVSLDEPRVQIGSLNMGSVNFGESVYINTVPDIRFWARRMAERTVIPELEIFNPSLITTSLQLRDEGVLPDPLHFNFCLGFPHSISADVRNLFFLADLLPEGTEWGLVHEGMQDLTVVSAALGMGARVLRVGFEDGPFLRRGEPARSNAELVANLVRLIRVAGCEVATPDEARHILGLSSRRTGNDRRT
ncbi:MAG: 3-keto-5-aminohexanoate cleavage protein [Spirochaetaceae bacterium]|nr:MAG: 3-keto-5-aminohexanoate cleavage protein [Spirochaetaceae bacterium]